MPTHNSSIELVVSDTGRASSIDTAARLPRDARQSLGVLSGDTIIIHGSSLIVATVWPATSGVPPDSIELSHELRQQAGVTLGDSVTVQTADVQSASRITFRASSPDTPRDFKHTIRSTLTNHPITTGDDFTINNTPITVLKTVPDGTVTLTDTTTIHVHHADEEHSSPSPQSYGVTFDDIGGLTDEIELVRETIEFPLEDPDTFADLGIEPPTGVLLYGPPGTGKTLIAKAVATNVDAHFYHISGPEITSKFKGESEERLREIFDNARDNAPSIIFFDEIDAIASTRESGNDMETRIVAQLLSLMDGLDAYDDVIVVGATNRIDTIDPALRRPGRFDREIEIGVPTESARQEILQIQTRAVPLAPEVSLDSIATRTHGFVGADIRALVTEAALIALRRTRESSSDTEVHVTMTDFEAALAAIDPSAMREFIAEIPSTTYADIGNLDEVKAKLKETIEWPLTYPSLFEQTATKPPTGVLLYGEPGTGKTLLARAVANESTVNFIHVAGPELFDKYVGESEKAIREVFDRARQAAPALIFFDEIDAIAGRRDRSHEVTDRVVSQLLTELDGLTESPNVTVLAATNRKNELDPAILRPGRLETHIEVPVPGQRAREDIFRVLTQDVPLGSDVAFAEIAERLDGRTGADIAAVVREAGLLAIRETITEHDSPAGASVTVEHRHFEMAVANIVPTE